MSDDKHVFRDIGIILATPFLVIIAIAFILFCPVAFASDVTLTTPDPRFCGAPERTEEGKIKRDMGKVDDFKQLYPCPSNGKSSGACPGWAVDHVIPLACGGCDLVLNMQWLPNEIKNHAGQFPKDRWERKVYCVYGVPQR